MSLINAIATYISGAELDRLSIRDFDNFEDTGVNWRIVEGYGATIAACGDSLPVKLNCPVQRIDHSGKRLRIETPDGTIEAEQVIVTLPTTVLAESDGFFTPSLPDKMTAAQNLPLGLADKLFLSLEHAEEFEKGQPAVRRHRSNGHGDLSSAAIRPSANRGLFWGAVRSRSRGEWRERFF